MPIKLVNKNQAGSVGSSAVSLQDAPANLDGTHSAPPGYSGSIGTLLDDVEGDVSGLFSQDIDRAGAISSAIDWGALFSELSPEDVFASTDFVANMAGGGSYALEDLTTQYAQFRSDMLQDGPEQNGAISGNRYWASWFQDATANGYGGANTPPSAGSAIRWAQRYDCGGINMIWAKYAAQDEFGDSTYDSLFDVARRGWMSDLLTSLTADNFGYVSYESSQFVGAYYQAAGTQSGDSASDITTATSLLNQWAAKQSVDNNFSARCGWWRDFGYKYGRELYNAKLNDINPNTGWVATLHTGFQNHFTYVPPSPSYGGSKNDSGLYGTFPWRDAIAYNTLMDADEYLRDRGLDPAAGFNTVDYATPLHGVEEALRHQVEDATVLSDYTEYYTDASGVIQTRNAFGRPLYETSVSIFPSSQSGAWWGVDDRGTGGATFRYSNVTVTIDDGDSPSVGLGLGMFVCGVYWRMGYHIARFHGGVGPQTGKTADWFVGIGDNVFKGLVQTGFLNNNENFLRYPTGGRVAGQQIYTIHSGFRARKYLSGL